MYLIVDRISLNSHAKIKGQIYSVKPDRHSRSVRLSLNKGFESVQKTFLIFSLNTVRWADFLNKDLNMTYHYQNSTELY
jgi:hypothetical protein